MHAAILLLALVCQVEPASPWDTVVRIHVVGGSTVDASGMQQWDAWDGSGAVIRSDGASATILTCNHIFEVKNPTPSVTVDLFNGKPEGWPQDMLVVKTEPATVIDRDVAHDLAMIKIVPGKRIASSR